MRWQGLARHSAQLNLTVQRQGQLRISSHTQRLHISRSLHQYSKLPHRQQLWEPYRSSRLVQHSRPLCSKVAGVAAEKREGKQSKEGSAQEVCALFQPENTPLPCMCLEYTNPRAAMMLRACSGSGGMAYQSRTAEGDCTPLANARGGLCTEQLLGSILHLHRQHLGGSPAMAPPGRALHQADPLAGGLPSFPYT